jgi:exonuclease III
MWNEEVMIRGEKGDEIVNFQSQAQEYRGLGFYMTQKWRERLIATKLINERIAVIRFRVPHGKKEEVEVAMINAYAPTMMKARSKPEVTEAFYQDLERTYRKERKGTEYTFILGDFNAKVGAGAEDDVGCMGRYGKGDRNENGDALMSFLVENKLYLANTHFRHRDRQIATWHKATQIGRANKSGIHNQIDYIVVPRKIIKLFNDARAIGPTRHRTERAN